MMNPVYYSQAVAARSGQVITTSTCNFPQQMISGPGKSTIMFQQSGYVPVNSNQRMVFGQVAAATNEQSVFGSNTITASQSEKTYTCQNQLTALQPNSFYVSTMPVHPSSQVFNGSHIRQISSQPQIATTQASEAMLNQTQLLGVQTVNPLQPGLSWAPSNIYQKPILFYNQQSGIRMVMHLPVAAAPQPIPSTSFAAAPQPIPSTSFAAAPQPIPSTSFVSSIVAPPMKKQCKLMPKGENLMEPSSGGSPNQTQIVNDEVTSTRMEIEPMSVQPNISLPLKDCSKILQASVVTTPTIDVSVVSKTPSTLTIGSSTGASASISNTPLATTDAFVNQVPSTLVTLQKFVAAYPTDPNPVQIVNEDIKSTGIEGKLVSVETKISSPQKLQAKVTDFYKIPHACLTPTSTVDVSIVSMASSPLTVESSTKSVITKSSVQVDTSVSSVDTITSSVPTVSSVSPDPCLTNIVSSNFNSKPSLPKAHNEVEFTSDQTNSKEILITTDHLKPQQSIQHLTSEPVKDKQKAIVKPQVLTHVINGFIIQESSEPFPISQSSLLDSPCKVLPPDTLNLPEEKKDTLTVFNLEKKMRVLRPRGIIELKKCEFCGKLGSHFRFKRKKRFCSKYCVKQFNKPNSKSLQTSSLAIQGYVGSGDHVRNKKKSRGRKRLQKQSLVEIENTNAVPAEKNPSTHENELTVSSKTKEMNSASENESTVSSNTWEENSVNESAVSDKPGKENCVPENESSVSFKTEEESSAHASDNHQQTLMEVDKSNDEVGKSISDLSQKLPSIWTVQDVFEFIQNFPGCSDYAENFKSQEVDGQALLLLNDNHLTTALCMKLGPALKLISQIRSMEEKLKSQLHQTMILL